MPDVAAAVAPGLADQLQVCATEAEGAGDASHCLLLVRAYSAVLCMFA